MEHSKREIRMKLPRVVGIGFFMIAAGTRVAADVSVSNDGLRATYEEPSRRLILAPRTSGASFAACDHFAPVDATVNAVTVNDKTFGKGKGLEVVHTNGQRDQVLLFPNKPFFFFRTTLKNGNAQTVTNRVAFQALTLNLGLPSSALNTLGTGGLLKPDKNPGSYMWTAVADPASRRGAVAGWVTTPTAAAVLCAWTSPMTSSASCRMWTTAASCSPPHRARRLRPSRWAFSMTSASASKPMPTPLPKSMPSACPPMPTVHCTWYVDGASRESVLTGRTDFAAQTLKPFGLGVIQIDDGWQLGNTKDGPKKDLIHYNPQGPYPSGMKPTADRIRKAGMTAGLWLIPFAGSSDDPWFADKSAWFAKKSDGKPYDTR